MQYFLRKQIGNFTDYPRLAGSEVHRFIALLHSRRKKGDRPFFYKSIKSAQNAWFAAWRRALEKNKPPLLRPDKENGKMFGAIGWNCINHYWQQCEHKPPPLAVEKRYSAPIMTGVDLIGIVDQTRGMERDTIRKYRPDLVVGNQLVSNFDEHYAPVVLVDLKTGKQNYDVGTFNPEAGLDEWARQQFSLHQDRQATIYTWLYKQVYNVTPIGFLLWDIRTGKTFFTYREGQDYQNMLAQVEHVVENIRAGSFPTNEGWQCKWCDYQDACRGERPFLVAKPGSVPIAPVVKTSADVATFVLHGKQLKLPGCDMPRRRKDPPQIQKLNGDPSITVLNPDDPGFKHKKRMETVPERK
jgi:hypothetical protein